MTLEQLRRQVAAGSAPQPEIHSIEGLIYIVRIDDDVLARGRDGSALRFPSVHAAGRTLRRAGLEHGWLVHSSPYDEMIGRADEGDPAPAPLRTRVRFPEQG